MEYGQYLRHFEKMGPDRIEAHLRFTIRDDFLNPDFARSHAAGLEEELRYFQKEPVPGVAYTRDNLTFKIDICAYTDSEHHVDYFDRLLAYFNVEYYKGISGFNQLGDVKGFLE